MKKFKLIIRPTLEHKKTFFFDSKKELWASLNTCADLLIFLHDNSLMHDYSNSFEAYEYENGDWEYFESFEK